MKAEGGRDLLFMGYIAIVIVLAVIYFSVPERKDFIEFQLGWWGELLDILGVYLK